MPTRILILDDEKLIRWSLNHVFLQEGFGVDSAETMDEAKRFCQKEAYGLILADLEVCGDQAASFFSDLARSQSGAKVIIMTAMPADQAERSLGEFKAYRIIEKPFPSEEIREVVKTALAGPAREHEA